jgi:SOS response regulatory protein OraA/RecX
MEEYEHDDLSVAVEIINKKIKFMEKSSVDVKTYGKLYRYLIYKGIDYDTARKALDLCLKSEDVEY